MRYYYYKKKRKKENFSKHSSKKIKKIISHSEAEIINLKEKINEYETLINFNKNLTNKIYEINRVILNIKKKDYESKSFLGKMLEANKLSQNAKKEIENLEKSKSEIENKVAPRYYSFKFEIKKNKEKIEQLQYRIEQALAILPTIELRELRQNEKKEKARQKYMEKAALAAAYTKKSREYADTIKKQLDKYDYCPYCQQVLGSNIHADHIYPVSKGGLSLPENMAFICAECNMKKKDLTLREFVKKYDFNWDLIENLLEKLGKKF